MQEKYKKSKGNAGLDGVQFQVNLLMVFLLNALRNLKGWKISTENQDAAKFDDVVIELSDKSTILLQAKVKENKKITKDQLLSDNSRNSEFSLPKYFFSYQNIKDTFNVKSVIICTNTNFDRTGLEDFLIPHTVSSDSLLHCEGATCSSVKFNENFLTQLEVSVNRYATANPKGIDKTVITKENLKRYLEKLELVFQYPCGDKLNKVIEKLLSNLSDFTLSKNVSPQELYGKVEEWFKQRCGEYLTEARADAMFREIKSDKYCEKLQNYNISFENNELTFSTAERIFHVICKGKGFLLQALKTYDVLKDVEMRKLFVTPYDDIETQMRVVDAFKLPKFAYLVIIWPKTPDEYVIRDISQKLRDILTKYEHKKIIIIAEHINELLQGIALTNCLPALDGSVTFQDLAEDCQKRLASMKSIIFQGYHVSLEELLATSDVDVYTKAVNCETLEKLIDGKEVKVGTQILDLNEDIARYYEERTFVREIVGRWNSEKNVVEKTEVFHEDSIFDIDNKVILISDSAGMGKSTVLSKLASDIKRKNSLFWVAGVKLSECTGSLKDSVRKNKESMKLNELLDFRSPQNHLEEVVFSMERRVVMIFDEFDEICPDYTKLLLNLLVECLNAPNFAKIVIATRPHMTGELKALLNVNPFVMQPFTEPNQVRFLVGYWMHNLALDNNNLDRCKKYAKALITKMLSWIQLQSNNEKQFTAIPLQVKMMADIFQENVGCDESKEWEGCKEFLLHEGTQPRLPEKLNITNLYDTFIEKKREVFIDKGSPNGNAAAIKALKKQFDECLTYHKSLALDILLDETKRNIFSIFLEADTNTATDLEKIGIVQRFDDKFHFVHRTFTEYFFAEALLTELQQNKNAEFQRFLVDELLLKPEYTTIRGFLENTLLRVEDDFPCHLFKKHKYSMTSKLYYHLPHDNLIFVLAQEGCVAILQLILRCLDYKIVINGEVHVETFRRDVYGKKSVFQRILRKNHFENSVDFLKSLLRFAGFNIRDILNSTPLHYAAERGHTQMVKFLLEQGANVNSIDADGNSALHLSARWGYLTVVRLLMKKGADVDMRNNQSITALHLAAQWGCLATVKFFVEQKAAVDMKTEGGNTALHLAAQWGRSSVVEFLARHGADTDTRNNFGYAAIHLASQRGWFAIVRSLVQHGAQINIKTDDGYAAIHLAAQNGRWNTVKVLVEEGADINIKNNRGCAPIHLVTQRGWLNSIKYLLKRGADINIKNDQDRTPLHLAVEKGLLDTVKFLVAQGAMCIKDDRGLSPILLAAQMGELDIVTFLMEQDLETEAVDSNGNTLLHLFAQNGNLNTVKFLLERGIDRAAKNNIGNTALHLAAEAGNLELAEELVGKGADVNIRNGQGCAPIHLAAQMGKYSIVEFLARCGADVNAASYHGNTALHLAAEAGEVDIVEFLIKQGANLNAVNDLGFAPIHFAAQEGKLDMLRVLVNCGAGITIVNSDGYTPMHLAAERGELDVVKYLAEWGGGGEDNTYTDC